MTTAEKLYKTAQALPEPLVAEILDFAEFLQKRMSGKGVSGKKRLVDVAGGLEASSTFSGDPVERIISNPILHPGNAEPQLCN
jgi:hypothetical protein